MLLKVLTVTDQPMLIATNSARQARGRSVRRMGGAGWDAGCMALFRVTLDWNQSRKGVAREQSQVLSYMFAATVTLLSFFSLSSVSHPLKKLATQKLA